VEEPKPNALAKLPPRCISRDPATGRLVVLVRGSRDFQLMSGDQAPEAYNGTLGLTYEQVEAMEYGAMFGFEAELADPDVVRRVREDMGLPVGAIKPAATRLAQAAAPAPAKAPAAAKPANDGMPDDLGNFVPWFQESLSRTRRA